MLIKYIPCCTESQIFYGDFCKTFSQIQTPCPVDNPNELRYTFDMVYEGFEPFVQDDSVLLILGSFPSVKSREEGFYYGNRQNRFWKLVAAATDEPVPQTVEQKKALLRAHKIALWDVVIACEIKGSMDKDIKNPVIADIPALLARYPIRHIVTNGGTAQKLLLRYHPALQDNCLPLPSTSPANARLNVSAWQNALRSLLTLA